MIFITTAVRIWKLTRQQISFIHSSFTLGATTLYEFWPAQQVTSIYLCGVDPVALLTYTIQTYNIIYIYGPQSHLTTSLFVKSSLHVSAPTGHPQVKNVSTSNFVFLRTVYNYSGCTYIFILISYYLKIIILFDSLRSRHIDICDKFLVKETFYVHFYVNLYNTF
jgi:hypothetical protein